MVLKCFPCAFHYSPIWIQHYKCTPHSTTAQTCHSSQATLPDSLQLSREPPHLTATETHLSLPNPPTGAQQLSFWQYCVFFFPTIMTIPWLVSDFSLVLLYSFPHWSPCVSWLLTGVLGWGFLLLFFSSLWRSFYFCFFLCSLCSCYTSCSAGPYSLSIALFHVPKDGFSLFRNVF